MQLHACFWDDTTSMRRARIGATRRIGYSRSFLVSQAFDPMLPMVGLAGHFCIPQSIQGYPRLLYILIGKDTWGRVLYFHW